VAAATGTFYGQPMTSGDIYTIAGGGTTSCPAGVGAPAPGTAAALSVPLGVAFAGDNSLFISDTANNCVRNLTAGQAVPGPPGSVTATSSGDGSATVRWLPPANPGGLPVSGYLVATVGGAATVDVGGGSTTATVSGLTNGTRYAFTVTAENTLGSGPASADSNSVRVRR